MINFKIKYYAKKHGKDIVRYGTYEPNNKKYRTWTDKKAILLLHILMMSKKITDTQ